MTSDFSNVYNDKARADAYDKLEYPGTYYLAFRDLPLIIGQHVKGARALDFGCGAGRSTRFLRGLGFDPIVGVDISAAMLDRARQRDPQGDYRLVPDGDLSCLENEKYDLIFAAFSFDNIPTLDKKVALFTSFRKLLASGGRMVNLVSAPEIYVHEWASFTTRDFPENRQARSGETVKIVMLDVEDRRPVQDILWTEDAYNDVYRQAGLKAIQTYHPLGNKEDPVEWVSEETVAPWAVYVVGSD
jgi:trans-aconitate methyltransferase